MRAETGLDSVAQAAGRCNREGEWQKHESHVQVFTTPDWKAPTETEQFAAGLRHVLRNHTGNLLAPEAITAYFEDVYWRKGDALDAKRLLAIHREHFPKLSFPFQNIARDFRLIDSIMQPVIVPFDDKVEKLVELLRHAEFVGGIARQLQPYLVQVPKNAIVALMVVGAVSVIQRERFGEQFMCLENPDLYAENTGLSWDNPVFIQSERTVM